MLKIAWEYKMSDALIESQTLLGVELLASLEDFGDYDPNNEIIPFDKLELAQESISGLIDIHNAISVEGVSTSDLLAVKDIQDRLTDSGIVLKLNSSLESYLPLVTADRSSINLTVSTESILKTIKETIKRWVQILVDAFNKTIRWFKSILQSDKLLMVKIKQHDNKAIRLEEVFNRVYRLLDNGFNDFTKDLENIATEVLTHSSLEKSPATLVAFNSKGYKVEMEINHASMEKLIKVLENKTLKLGEVLNKINSDPNITSQLQIHFYDSTTRIPTILDKVEQLFVAVDDVNYLVNHKDVGVEFYKNTTNRLKDRTFFGYRHIFDAYNKAADALTKIQRIKLGDNLDTSDYEALNGHFAGITEDLNGINQYINQLANLRNRYIKVSATHVNFYLMALDHMHEKATIASMDDTLAANINKLRKTVMDIRKSMGL